jgi:hypothetical protein
LTRRPSADAIVCFSLFLLCAARSDAQVNLVPGGRIDVQEAPDFVALGNLDGDGAQEAVLLSPASSVLSVFNADPAGALQRTISRSIGRRLSGVQVRDFDGDGLHDVLLADATGGAQPGSLLLLRGAGNGTLGPPEPFPLPISALRTFATGNIDGINGPDAVLATGTRDEVAILLNDGTATAFTALPLYELRNDPRRVRVARIDQSGRDSILVLNTNLSRTEEIAILRLDDGAVVQPIAPIRIPGSEPLDFLTGDFNRDGANDIVVVHSQVDETFFITTMLNQTVTSPTGSEPTGRFTVLPALGFDCPATPAGELTRCVPASLAAGDFDRDGFTDVAVAFSRPGEILFLNGIGGGEFGLAGRFRSNDSVEPVTIAAGDMSGNFAADLFVGDVGNDTVLLLRSNVPTPQEDGEDCQRGNECASQVCLDGVCCRFLTCPSGQRCDVPGSEGNCAPLAPIGSACDGGETCGSGFCVDGVCCANPLCPDGQTCALPGSAGVCRAAPPTATPSPTRTATPLPSVSPTPQPIGRPCTGASQCQSTLCEDGFCCSEVCPDGRYCNISGSFGTCAPRKFIGQACSADTDCLTLTCAEGLCAAAASPTPQATATPTQTPIPAGAPCTASDADNCANGFCTDGVCCSEARCAPGERCDISADAGDCRNQLPPGSPCSKDTDCRAGGRCEFSSAAGGLICTASDPGPVDCFGDCNDDLAVTVDEILVMIEIALGTQPLDNCARGDIGGDGMISVDELLVAVALALTGCPDITLPTPTLPPPPPATPTPSATVDAATATPAASSTPTPSPTPDVPTATVTPTAAPTSPGLDLSAFDEFRFARSAEPGDCPPLGATFAATIVRAGSVHVLDLDVLRTGDPESGECLPDLAGVGECAVVRPVSPVPTILTVAEVNRLGTVFGAVGFSQGVDESCQPESPVCARSSYDWDGLKATDDPCGDTNRLANAKAAAILAFLDDLRSAREAVAGAPAR